MLQNNLDPDVAFDPDNLIVYGGAQGGATGRRSTPSSTRCALEADETLLVQSGKPSPSFVRTPMRRVLIANSNIVPAWATQENFDKWEAAGLIMYGQMTAGSWICIGTQGILQGTYETLGSLARQRGWGSLAGKLVLTSGLGEMGGAQPLAITMNEGVGLIIEVDRWRAERRLQMRQIDAITDNMEEALTWVEEARAARTPKSVGLIGNAAEVLPELVLRGVRPDVVTDQTSAHDPLYGYIPAGLSLEEAADLRRRDPAEYQRLAADSMTRHVQAMLDWQAQGATVFDYGNNLRQRAYDNGLKEAFSYPGFVPAYIRPLFCEGKGPCWVALSGDPPTSTPPTRPFSTYSRRTSIWCAGSSWPSDVAFQGCRRICWLGYGERHLAGLRFNELVPAARQGAIVIGATTSTAARSPAPTARPKACATAPTPSPTGRSSTR